MTSDTVQFAWAVGLFEGEGTIFSRTEPYRARRLTMSSTDEDVLRRFHAIVGVGRLTGPHQSKQERRKPYWRWSVDRWDELAPLTEAMLPLLGERRATAARALLANTPRKRQRATYCKRGHVLAETARVTKSGARQCRECVRHIARERKAAA